MNKLMLLCCVVNFQLAKFSKIAKSSKAKRIIKTSSHSCKTGEFYTVLLPYNLSLASNTPSSPLLPDCTTSLSLSFSVPLCQSPCSRALEIFQTYLRNQSYSKLKENIECH